MYFILRKIWYVERARLVMYSCQPCVWSIKGTRQSTASKGTYFEHISAQGLKTTLLEINQRPLKILDWQTPYQVMLTNLSKNSD